MHSKDANHVLGGSLQLSTLSYFRALEWRTKSAWIGDKYEGVARYTGEVHVHFPQTYNRFGIKMTAVGHGIVGPQTVIHPDCYVFCFSTGAYAPLRAAMCEREIIDENYDACVRIINKERLLSRIYYEGRVQELDGRAVQEVVQYLEMGCVVYASGEIPIADRRDIDNSPFRKEEHFRSQAETRIVCELKGRSTKLDKLRITLPRPERLFVRVE